MEPPPQNSKARMLASPSESRERVLNITTAGVRGGPTRKAAEMKDGETEDEYMRRIKRNEMERKWRAEKKAANSSQEIPKHDLPSVVLSSSKGLEESDSESMAALTPRSERRDRSRESMDDHGSTSKYHRANEQKEGESDEQYARRMRRNEADRRRHADKKTEEGRTVAQQRENETNEQFATRIRRNELEKIRCSKKNDSQGNSAMTSNSANSLLVEVVQGDITQQGIEMVINAAHEQLIPGGGIDGAIRSVEGHVFNALTAQFFTDYCTDKNRTTLDYGDYLIVPANAITGAKCVAHVVGPRLAQGAIPSAGDRLKMIRAYQAAFSATENSGCQEVVIPFIGSGIFHYPMDQSQYLALFTVLRRLPKLKRIVFCHTDAHVVAAFAHLMGGNTALRVDSQAHADSLAKQLLGNVSTRTVATPNPNGVASMDMNGDSHADTRLQKTNEERMPNKGRQTDEEIRRRNVQTQREKAQKRTGEEQAEVNSKRKAMRRAAITLNKKASNIIPHELKDYSQIENSAPRQLNLGQRSKCEDCNALTYTGNCCQNGSVCTPPPVEQPEEIKELLTGTDPDSAHFRQEAVAYNSSFAMGSLSYNREKTSKGPPFAKVNGMMHHLMGALETPEGKTPLFQQIYKYDVDEAVRYRKMNPVNGLILKPKIVKRLTELFTKKNFLAKQFKTVDEILEEMKEKKIKSRNFCLVLRSPTEAEFHGADHPGTLERPRKELESFLYQELDDGGPPKYGVWVVQKKTGSKLACLGYFNPVVDPVCYPLIFPYGQSGYKYGEYKRNDPNLHVTPSRRQQEETDEEEDDFGCEENDPTAPENQRSLFADSDEEQGDGEMADLQEGMQGIEVSPQEEREAMDWEDGSGRRDAVEDETAGQCGAPKGKPRTCGGAMANDDDEELRDEDILETELESRQRGAATGAESHEELPDCDVNLLRNPYHEQPNMEDDEDIELEQSDINYTPTGRNRKRQFVSRREFLLHQMQMRDPQFHPVLSALLLGQLYVIDQALRVIRQRNDNMRKHCIELRGATAQSLNFLHQSRRALQKGYNLGYVFRMSRKAAGSAGWYKERFENAMAVIDKIGKPDLFITMTGDPNWPEIKENLLPNSNWQSNPFLVNDVFYRKMQELIDDVVEKELFGPVLSFCYSVEFQKRGMPHMHMLLTLAEGSKLRTPEDIDKHIWARIPPKPEVGEDNYEEKLRFHNNVVEKMVHTPCEGRPDAYCNERPSSARNRVFTTCTKFFPVHFAEFTSLKDGGKVQHKRPNDGITCTKKAGNQTLIADNRYVVPYNPFLLNKYSCHINVEAVTRVNVVKYIYKYIYKGFDKALVQIVENFEVDNGAPSGQLGKTTVHASQNGETGVMAPTGIKGTMRQWRDINERVANELKKMNITPADGEKLTAYDEAIMVEVFRQLTASEAAWIIQAYPLAGLSHTVKNLAVHDEGEQNIFFKKGDEMNAAAKAGEMRSMLLAWFDLNEEDPSAREYTFDEIPQHYKFEKKPKNKWTKYLRKPSRIVVRVRPVSPRFLNKFAIRLLVLHQKGPTSFEELRTVNGVVHPNAQEAAKALGLMNSELEFALAMSDACKLEHPRRLRRLFATILVFGCPKDPLDLWKQFEDEMYNPGMANQRDRARAAALYHIQWLLNVHSMKLKDFNLPECEENLLQRKDKDEAIDVPAMATVVDVEAEAKKLIQSLNQEQKMAFNRIVKAVQDKGNGNDGNCFFLHGSGGCGKTYVYTALYYFFEHVKVTVTMVATTGIASTLLIKGTTAHRKFMLPLNLANDGRSTMRLETSAADELRKTRVIIFDEATMAHKNVYSAIDHLLRDIMEIDMPFGGKIMLLGGDWKQLLPVVPGASSDEAVRQTLKADPLWEGFKVLRLNQNMRAKEDADYAMLLENVGNGMQNGTPSTTVDLKPECICKEEEEVLEFIYGGKVDKVSEIASSCVLTTLNAETTEINEKVLMMLPGEPRTYNAIDTPMDGVGMQVPPEYFKGDMESGMPPFALNLKIASIVILLRNLNVLRGLCNGTRMEVVDMRDHIIVCRLISTKFAGKVVWIAKAKMTPADGNPKKAKYERFQFPLRLAYSMTINKAQGQTYDKVGIILRNNPFSHGQLYVALSRARKSSNVRVYSSATAMTGDGRKKITVYNKVERSVLEDVDSNTLRSATYVHPEPVEPLVKLVTPHKAKRAYNAIDFSAPAIQPRRKVSRTTSVDATSRRDESTIEIMDIDVAPLLPFDHGAHLLLVNVQLSCFLNTIVQCLRAVGPLNSAIIQGVGRGERCDENVCGALTGLLMARGINDANNLREALANTLSARNAEEFMSQESCVNEVLRQLFAHIPSTATDMFTFVERSRAICYSCFDRQAAPQACALIPLVVHQENISLNALLDTQRGALRGGCANCRHAQLPEALTGETMLYYENNGGSFVIFMLSITDVYGRKIDYKLAEGEDLNALRFAGSTWRAIAMAEHHGNNKPGKRGGHYTAWTKDDDSGEWWRHDDSNAPTKIGAAFRKTNGVVDMRGITTIVCRRAN